MRSANSLPGAYTPERETLTANEINSRLRISLRRDLGRPRRASVGEPREARWSASAVNTAIASMPLDGWGTDAKAAPSAQNSPTTRRPALIRINDT